LAVGGTGKTPHIEYLVGLLKDKYRVAVLSRGYKRSTSGFVLASADTECKHIGDEPYQIKTKFPSVIVAVDEKRCRGIENLLELPEQERPQVILLDDAYQHRYVRPSFSILLTDYNRPYYEDKLLPAGRLREPASYAEYASMILVTKSPETIKPIDMRIIQHGINAYPYQTLLFTSIDYGNLTPVFGGKKAREISLSELKNRSVLLVSGIANPRALVKKIKKLTNNLEVMSFPDHHNFSKKNIANINSKFANMNDSDKLIVVTEKDASRLKFSKGLDEELKKRLYSIPISVSFLSEEDQLMFNSKIFEHVRKNTRNS
jgi:tetraacyldisaccharide 4'-kinase